jgi:hypothetical protein
MREYLETLIAAHRREIDVKNESTQTAVLLAKEEVYRRLGELNQLRSEVISDREQFVSKLQFEPMMQERDAWRSDMTDKLTAINERIAKIEARGSTWTLAIGLFFVVLQIALMFLLRK